MALEQLESMVSEGFSNLDDPVIPNPAWSQGGEVLSQQHRSLICLELSPPY